MKRTASLLLLVLIAGCRGAPGLDLEPIEVPPGDVAALVRADNRFALALYDRIREGEGNRFLSPLSVAAGLSMTWAGARGETARQMAEVLRIELPPERQHAAFHRHLYELSPPEGRDDVDLAIANALWVQRGRALAPAFTGTVTGHYGAEARPVDFVADPAAALGVVNDWVARRTNRHVRGLLPSGSVDDLTRLLLTGAIWFKGKWEEDFDPDLTRTEPFRLAGGKVKPWRFMHQHESFAYAGLEGLSLLEMPYRWHQLSMVVILPDEVDGLPALEASLDAEKLAGWLDAMEHRQVMVAMPRFRFSASMDLHDALAAMGMPDAFGSRADFSGMDGTKELSLAGARHKAFVQVDEEGTEAAATWGFVFAAKAAAPGEPVVFRADHPFLFLIRDRATGAILFLGRVTEPVEE